MWLSAVQFIFSLLMATRSQATEAISCSIPNRHLQLLDALIDSQLQSSCTITWDFVDPAQVTDEVCYVQVAFEFLNDVFNTHMKFNEHSLNYNNTKEVKELFGELQRQECIPAMEKGCCKQCAMTFTMSPQEMLKKVKDVFEMSEKLLKNNTVQMGKSCMEQIAQCRRSPPPAPTGPAQCDCSCPSLKNLLTTSSNWEQLPNTSTDNLSAGPTIMPACQGTKGIGESSVPPKDLSDTVRTPVAISDPGSGRGSFKTPGETVNPSFLLSPVAEQSVPHGQDAYTFSTEPSSVQFTLVVESQTTGQDNIWSSSSKNLMSDGESGGATAVAQSMSLDLSQTHSSQPVFRSTLHSSSVRRTSGKGSGDKVAAQKSLLSSVPQNNKPTVAPSKGAPFTASKKGEDPAKESRSSWKVSPTLLSKGILAGLEELITKAKPPTKRHSSAFRSKGGGESAQSFNEREEHFAGPRSELYSFSVTDAGGERAQGRLQPDSQRSIVFSVLPIVAGLLLTLCGLLYYRHKSKLLQRMLTATLPEERPLNRERIELQVQGIV
ncbi:macrophage colony-stimulating factor 1 [Microcaecilia unicolor]|uniref:Macrophage colony-stimulating factor 1 n=1 Tax=Microcaecilia unicolor TaxID=1415580 RepID=A0A6P7ZH17_9AMPH|nr:macrophage colony-stimulating factor 1 [Microcaecilia unicolor]